jgi:hypothetical protein
LSAADSTIGLSALRKRAETARGGARRSGLARVTTDRNERAWNAEESLLRAFLQGIARRKLKFMKKLSRIIP